MTARDTATSIICAWYERLAPGERDPYEIAKSLMTAVYHEIVADKESDLLAQLNQANRTIEHLREQHRVRSYTEAQTTRNDRTYRAQYEAEKIQRGINLDRALRAEHNAQAWVRRAFDAERELARLKEAQQ